MTVRELLSFEIGASAEDLDDLFSAFGTAGIEVIDAEDERFAGLDKIPGEKEFKEIPEGVSYAAPSFAPLAISPFDVIFNDLTIRGFSIGNPTFAEQLPQAIRAAAQMIATHEVTVPIAAIYPLDEIKAAVTHALRGGKVLLEVGGAHS